MPAIGNIQPTSISHEMKRSYLDYAMSVIVSRAIPDVRDGLKPVHRRVLFAMHKLGLSHHQAYKKCARIVGETIGKYHPHGDVAVYDTLVRLAQNFSLRYPLISGQGNFGTVDGDSPAAMRYTEARLSKITQELLGDLDKDTVDFLDNFDGSEQEPLVLPAKLPSLILNGADGIAVGMATKIPPHHLGEVVDALVFIIEKIKIIPAIPDAKTSPQSLNARPESEREKPNSGDLKAAAPKDKSVQDTSFKMTHFEISSEVTVEDLVKYIKGPDFPTGGVIYDQKQIIETYKLGRGRILVRAKAEIIEEEKGRFQIAITELPYQQNKALLVARIAGLVREEKIKDIADLRDESDRRGLKIAIDLKRTGNPRRVLNQLFKYTSLQQTYHANMVTLAEGEPKTLSLKSILLEYLSHRKTVIIRRTIFDLKKAKEREHILQGLKIALDHLDEVIETIKRSRDAEVAHANLVRKFNLTPIQAQAILDMQLRRLSALEREKILNELSAITKQIENLEGILVSPEKIMGIIKEELTSLKKEFNDERRTKIVKSSPEQVSEEELIENTKAIVILSRDGYIKRVTVDTYRRQGRGGKGVKGGSLKQEDVVADVLTALTHDTILFFTDRGRVFSAKVYEIPEASRTARGQALVNLIGTDSQEKVHSVLTLSNNP